MLFNSYEFILIFLVGVIIVYAIAGHVIFPSWVRKAVLILASAIFISYGGVVSLVLLLTSMAVNYLILRRLEAERDERRRKCCVFVSVIFNLSFIGIFKYADLFINSAAFVLDREPAPLGLALPLANSFYTFQLIALAIDSWRHNWRCPAILDYVFFVIFFPQLIAGLIVRLQEVRKEIQRMKRLVPENIAAGISVFCLGLFKKAFVADALATHSDTLFFAVESGQAPAFFEAWGGVLLYTFQRYFDFSGYSDMAIGLAWIFGISLPVNFWSPYKTRSIIEFRYYPLDIRGGDPHILYIGDRYDHVLRISTTVSER